MLSSITGGRVCWCDVICGMENSKWADTRHPASIIDFIAAYLLYRLVVMVLPFMLTSDAPPRT